MSSRVSASLHSCWSLLFFVLLLNAAPHIASAQYMYLDSNGDGVNTAADQVNPLGLTQADIYLRTDQNRDGTPAVCPVSGDVFSVNSYVVILRASGGTMTWSSFVNRQATMTIHFPTKSSTTELVDSYAGGTALPPGLYRLATVTLSVLSGSPSLQIVDWASSFFYIEPTLFGSGCGGLDGDNTLKLGSDWFDVDGLAFGTTTPVNHPPTLAALSDMTVAASEVASQTVSASDPDLQVLTITKSAGPSFMAYLPSVSDRGSAMGTIRLSPAAADAGSFAGALMVTDGELSAEQTFAIQVTPPASSRPVLDPLGNTLVLTGTIRRELLYARDSDGQRITFRKNAGPNFVSVASLSQGPAAATGEVRMAPTLCDVGPWQVEIAAESGGDQTVQTIHLEVGNAGPPPSGLGPPFTVGRGPLGLHLIDVNGDGTLDVVSANDRQNTVTVGFGRGDGSFAGRTDYPVGVEPFFVASGDWNQDGNPDLAVANAVGTGISVLLGSGDGSFHPGAPLTAGATPLAIAVADLNRDGRDDLVTANAGSNFISVFLGAGGGLFLSRADFPLDGSSSGVLIADLNRDGRLDVITSSYLRSSFSFFPGYGDGTFGVRRDTPCAGHAFTSDAGDIDGDGILDLAVGLPEGKIQIFHGNGDGSLSPVSLLDCGGSAESLALRDFNGDGRLDLAAGGITNAVLDYFEGLGTGSFAQHRTLSLNTGAIEPGDLDRDGRLDLVGTDTDQNLIQAFLNPGLVGAPPNARAFVQGSHRSVGSSSSSAPYGIRLEPVDATYANEDVDRTSIKLLSEGTGTVASISAVIRKTESIGDTDHNGVPEIEITFLSGDLADLFSNVSGRGTVNARLEGALLSGHRFCSNLSLPVSGTRTLAATVTPNPLNPNGILSFDIGHPGSLRVRLFDLQGRLVRQLLDERMVPAGRREIPIDGKTSSGTPLASGIYLYRIDTLDGSTRGRFTILK